MRTGLPGAPSPHPIGLRLPAVYLEYEFLQRFTEALDEVLAPVLLTLDSFPAYLDPHTAPDDILEWLAGWVALALDDSWTDAQRRALVATAVQLHRWRGTKRGLVAHVQLLTGATVEIADNGGCTWSAVPGAAPPGASAPLIDVVVRTSPAHRVDTAQIRSLIADALPAHVPVTVRAVAVGRARVGPDDPPPGSAPPAPPQQRTPPPPQPPQGPPGQRPMPPPMPPAP
jgi:phage tail-like protein